MDNTKSKCGGACCCCLLFIGMIIFLSSIETIEPIEYGVMYNSFDKQIKDEVYDGGWYLAGPFNKFIVFPSTLINLDWGDQSGANRPPLKQVKDADKQDIEFGFSIQYKLNRDNIAELYNNYQLNYERQFISWADATVREVIGTFKNTKFWENRQEAGETLRAAINEKFKKEKNYLSCVSFQITNVQFNSQRENVLIETQIKTHLKNTLEQIQLSTLARARIKVTEVEALK